MTVRSLFPILRTRDLGRLVAFYSTAFGATEHYRWDDVYVALSVGGGSLGIGREPAAREGDQLSIWIYVDDVDAVHQACLDAGATSLVAPDDMPWGERVAQLHDPDGNLLYLGATSAAGASNT
jgi:uncharacterized glyoxalase superfamily protein PhnB